MVNHPGLFTELAGLRSSFVLAQASGSRLDDFEQSAGLLRRARAPVRCTYVSGWSLFSAVEPARGRHPRGGDWARLLSSQKAEDAAFLDVGFDRRADAPDLMLERSSDQGGSSQEPRFESSSCWWVIWGQVIRLLDEVAIGSTSTDVANGRRAVSRSWNPPPALSFLLVLALAETLVGHTRAARAASASEAPAVRAAAELGSRQVRWRPSETWVSLIA